MFSACCLILTTRATNLKCKYSLLISLAKTDTCCSVVKTGKSCDINNNRHITPPPLPSTAAHTQTSNTHINPFLYQGGTLQLIY